MNYNSSLEVTKRIEDVSKQPHMDLWVLNTTGINSADMPGEILIDITQPGDDPKAIKIFRTWIPINLAAQMPKAAILGNSAFVKQVYEGRIKILLREEVEEIFNKNAELIKAEELRLRNVKMEYIPEKEDTPKISIAAESIMRDPELTEIQKISQLMGRRQELTPEDLIYIENSLNDKSLIDNFK